MQTYRTISLKRLVLARVGQKFANFDTNFTLKIWLGDRESNPN